jgi:hypothetical protein
MRGGEPLGSPGAEFRQMDLRLTNETPFSRLSQSSPLHGTHLGSLLDVFIEKGRALRIRNARPCVWGLWRADIYTPTKARPVRKSSVDGHHWRLQTPFGAEAIIIIVDGLVVVSAAQGRLFRFECAV